MEAFEEELVLDMNEEVLLKVRECFTYGIDFEDFLKLKVNSVDLEHIQY